MRQRTLGVSTAVLAAAALVLTLVTPASAHMKMHCNNTGTKTSAVGRGPWDPVAHHLQGAVSHDHTFFANKGLPTLPDPSAATYAGEVGAPTACDNSDDTASYWIPTFYQRTGDGVLHPMVVHAIIAYYRPWWYPIKRADTDGTSGTTRAHEPDARLVAGNANATGPQSKDIVNWTCNQSSSRPGPYTSAVQAACNTATGSVVRLGVHIDFPGCWDGLHNNHAVVGNTADFSGAGGVVQHYAMATGTVTNPTCPSGFGKHVSTIRLEVQFENWNGGDYRGNGTDLFLSSGPPQSGYTAERSQWTLHGDFWTTWVQTGGAHGGYVGAVTQCVNTATSHPHGSSPTCGT